MTAGELVKRDDMPKLILLNGPPASGKSTIAQHLVARRPLALDLDIDIVRSLLGAWHAQPPEAGVAARKLALAMAATHLDEGRDVIVPQLLAREHFIDQLAEVALSAGARFVEIALEMTRDDAVAAFNRRSELAATEQHRDAANTVQQAGGVAALDEMYDALIALWDRRPLVRRVHVVVGDVAATVARVEAAIAMP